MALKDVYSWNSEVSENSSACGTACGASSEPEEKPSACGSACGASDK